MDALGVRRPDVMPRVSDYIPQIVAYIARIQANGIAYERDGSVYFDTAAFECARGCAVSHLVTECSLRRVCCCVNRQQHCTHLAGWRLLAQSLLIPAWENRWHESTARPGARHVHCRAACCQMSHSRLRTGPNPLLSHSCDVRPGERGISMADWRRGRWAPPSSLPRARPTSRPARSATPATSHSGRPPSRASRTGHPSGATADQVLC